MQRVYSNYGCGKHRKGTCLKGIKIEDTDRKAIIRFHSLSGNDYIPALFRKGEKHSWNIISKENRFRKACAQVGINFGIGRHS